jgi:hypothetical protein
MPNVERDVVVTCCSFQENTYRTCLTWCVVIRYLSFSKDEVGKKFSSYTIVNIYAVNLRWRCGCGILHGIIHLKLRKTLKSLNKQWFLAQDQNWVHPKILLHCKYNNTPGLLYYNTPPPQTLKSAGGSHWTRVWMLPFRATNTSLLKGTALKAALSGFIRHRGRKGLLYPRPWSELLHSPLEAPHTKLVCSTLC